MPSPSAFPTASPTPLDRFIHPLGAAIAWLVLRPMRLPSLRTPGLAGLRYQALRLRGEGPELAAWYIPREGSRAGIVLCHGHNDCRNQFYPLLRPLHEAGFHLILFDFRSMGLSGGDVCTYGLGEKEDVHRAIHFLREEAEVENVGLFGISMGGATALLAAAEDPTIQAVTTDCAFARLDDMVEQFFHYLPTTLRAAVARSVRTWCIRWKGDVLGQVDPEAAVRQWQTRPLLVVHAQEDRLTPVAHAHRLAAAAGEGAELWVVPDAPHVGCRRKAGREYFRRVTHFFQRHLLASGGSVANP